MLFVCMCVFGYDKHVQFNVEVALQMKPERKSAFDMMCVVYMLLFLWIRIYPVLSGKWEKEREENRGQTVRGD